MTLFLSKNLETSDKELLVLAVLNGLYTNKHETLFSSVDDIGYFATGRFLETKKDKTIIQGIKQGIKSLADRKIIEIIDNHKDNYIFTSKGLTVTGSSSPATVLSDVDIPIGAFTLTYKKGTATSDPYIRTYSTVTYFYSRKNSMF